jgi:hypothetical protein
MHYREEEADRPQRDPEGEEGEVDEFTLIFASTSAAR